MGNMKHSLDYRPTDSEPIPKKEKPIVAAAIVFMPIIGAVVLLICYVLLHK